MENKRTLTRTEIENLPEKIKKWCIYEPEGEGGCYNYYDVTITEYDNCETVIYDINGSLKITVYDAENMDIDTTKDGVCYNCIYEEDDEKIDDRTSSTTRVITFKNPESKVKWKSVARTDPTYILVTYRNGEQKFINLFDEQN